MKILVHDVTKVIDDVTDELEDISGVLSGVGSTFNTLRTSGNLDEYVTNMLFMLEKTVVQSSKRLMKL